MNKRSDRRSRALSRLETQLSAGTKVPRKSTKKVPLTETDKKRIEKEIDILKTKK